CAGLEDVLPRDRGCRRPPAQGTDRRCGVRDAEELARGAVRVAQHVAVSEMEQGTPLDPRARMAAGCQRGDRPAGEGHQCQWRRTSRGHPRSLPSWHYTSGGVAAVRLTCEFGFTTW